MQGNKTVTKVEKVVEVEEAAITLTLSLEEARVLWTAAQYFREDCPTTWMLKSDGGYSERPVNPAGKKLFSDISRTLEEVTESGEMRFEGGYSRPEVRTDAFYASFN